VKGRGVCGVAVEKAAGVRDGLVERDYDWGRGGLRGGSHACRLRSTVRRSRWLGFAAAHDGTIYMAISIVRAIIPLDISRFRACSSIYIAYFHDFSLALRSKCIQYSIFHCITCIKTLKSQSPGPNSPFH
jgi:hypothetical protein